MLLVVPVFNYAMGWKKLYIPYKLSSKVIDWKSKWFYVNNHAPPLRVGYPVFPNTVANGLQSLRACSN